MHKAVIYFLGACVLVGGVVVFFFVQEEPFPTGTSEPKTGVNEAPAPLPATHEALRPPPGPPEQPATASSRWDNWVPKMSEKSLAAQAAFEAERVDTAWADMAKLMIEEDFKLLDERLPALWRFDLLSLVCRTTRCMAELEFTKFSEAMGFWENGVNERLEPSRIYPFKIGCPVTHFFPEPRPDRRNERYRGKLYFDCTRRRVKESPAATNPQKAEQ